MTVTANKYVGVESSSKSEKCCYGEVWNGMCMHLILLFTANRRMSH